MVDFTKTFFRVIRYNDSEGAIMASPDGKRFPVDPDPLLTGLVAGDVIRVTSTQIIRVDPENWVENTKVGVVQTVKDADVLLDIDTTVVSATNPDAITLSRGNTVLVNASNEILRIVSDAPVRGGVKIAEDDFDIDRLKQPPSNMLRWDDFGGFPAIVDEAKEIVDIHLARREKFEKFKVTPLRGVIFEGAPGTGKTFLGRIMANRAEASLYIVSGSELGGRLFGESEGRLQGLYDQASKEEGNVIIFIDEIDSITRQRGSDAGTHSDRLVSTFLQNMDGFKAKDNILTIGTTNRVDDIDKALLRPGRFGKVIHFGAPTLSDRQAILQIGAERESVSSELDLGSAAASTESWTGADLDAVWTAAATLAVAADRTVIAQDHFDMAIESVSRTKTSEEVTK